MSVTNSSPRNFSWLFVNEIAGSACPTSLAELQWLKQQGIRHIVTSSVKNQPKMICKTMFRHHVIDIQNFEGPTVKQIERFIKICQRAREKNEAILVHCMMGVGRTGTLLTCYLMVFYDLNVEEALKALRDKRPNSVETKEQMDSLKRFYQYYMEKKRLNQET